MKPGYHQIHHINGTLPNNSKLRWLVFCNGDGKTEEQVGYYNVFAGSGEWLLKDGIRPSQQPIGYSDSRLYKKDR